MPDKISVIITIKNEAASINRLLDTLQAQTRPPDEIVIVDGGSTDGTIEIVRDRVIRGEAIQLIVEPGANISRGRNIAIQNARGDIIASTDAGVHLVDCWLEKITAPFADSDVHVVSGFFLPDPQSVFETALGATTLPVISDINAEIFLPSSRSVAFRKTAWEKVGGYPEWLDYCEDIIFDFRLRAHYLPFPFVPEALAYFRPRSSLRAFFVQYYRYSRGDGKSDLWRKRHFIRYMTYLVVAPLLLFMILWHSPWWLLLLLLGVSIYTYVPYRRLMPMIKEYSLPQKLHALALVPLIRVVGDIAKMIGYPVGLLWRAQNAPPDWRTIE